MWFAAVDEVYLLVRLSFHPNSVSGVQAASYSYNGEFHSDLTRTRASAFLAMFMPGCFVYLPLLAWLIIPMQWTWYLYDMKISPWRLYLLCSSLINGVNFVMLGFFPESPKFLLTMNKKEKSLEILRSMYAWNSGNKKEVMRFSRVVFHASLHFQSNSFSRTFPLRICCQRTLAEIFPQ